MNCANGGFGAEQICRPDLNAGCAQRHRRRNAPCISDAAGGDDRDLHFLHNLRQKGERADLSSEIFRQENATVSARLETLRDDGSGRSAAIPKSRRRKTTCWTTSRYTG